MNFDIWPVATGWFSKHKTDYGLIISESPSRIVEFCRSTLILFYKMKDYKKPDVELLQDAANKLRIQSVETTSECKSGYVEFILLFATRVLRYNCQ